MKKVSPSETDTFYKHVKSYFISSCNYIVSNFPIHCEVLKNAVVADIRKKESLSFSSLKFFIEKFPCILPREESETVYEAIDNLENEFLSFQTFEISKEIFNLERPDEQWAMIGKEHGSLGKPMFRRLSKAMLGILTFPHSNASCERVFSQVRRNKTDFRSSLNTSTLQSILIAKSHISNVCYEQKYPVDFLKKAKSATMCGLNTNGM